MSKEPAQMNLPGEGMEGEFPELDRAARAYLAIKREAVLKAEELTAQGEKVKAAMEESQLHQVTVEGVTLRLNTSESLTLSGWKKPHDGGE